MSILKDEKQIRVTVKRKDEEELKLLCRELLLEARSHKIAGIDFDFWHQASHIVRKKIVMPPSFVMPPSASKRNISTGMVWAFVTFGAFCAVFVAAAVFNL